MECQRTHDIELVDVLTGPETVCLMAIVDGYGIEADLRMLPMAGVLALDLVELRQVIRLPENEWPDAVRDLVLDLMMKTYHALLEGASWSCQDRKLGPTE